jgi:tetratricopeptide (TPR) repeat protein
MSRLRALLLAPLLGLAACNTNSFGYREQGVDPDQRLAAALEEYEAVVGGDRDPNRAHVLIDPDRARRVVERLAFEFPRHAPTRMANAVIAWSVRDGPTAVRHLDVLLELRPSHPEAAMLRAEIAIEEGNVPFALRLLERQTELAPAHPGLQEALGAARYAAGDWKGARDALDLALRLGAPEWRVAFHRGLVDEAAGDLHEAWRHYADAVYARPDFEPAAARLSGARARLGLPPIGALGREPAPEEG